MRFLHLADIHLDTAFRGRSDHLRRELRDASRQAFGRAVDEAIHRELDAVLIAGDLFDGERLSVRTERFLGESLVRLEAARVSVVYVTGNHDPGGPGGVRSTMTWPEHVHLIDGPEPARIPISRREDPGTPAAWITGSGHDNPRVTEDLSRRFPRPSGDRPEVALLHTQVGGARGQDAHEPYAPSRLDRLRSAGYDYWALGHVHARQELSADPPIHYPGNLQGRHPGESGPRGGLVVELDPGSPARIEFVELGPIRWETLRLTDLDEVHRLSSLAGRIEARWNEARATDPGTAGAGWILRVELEGASPLHGELRLRDATDELRDDLGSRLGLLDVEVRRGALRPHVRLEDHLGRDDVLGEALRTAVELAGPDGPSPSRRLGISPEDLAGAPTGEPGALDAYLRDLLQGADAELLATLLQDGDG